MNSIMVRAGLVALASAVASILLAITIVPTLGGTVDGNAWMMCILCPLLIAWPASAYTFWQSDRLKAAHRELSRTHAQLAAAHRRLSEKASRDEMTGLLNRESFFSALDRSRRRSDRGALLIIDADHFKAINDNYGHLTGDEALLLISAAIKSGIRAGDVLGRIGGEEFGAFLVGASEQEARSVAERVRREVERVCFCPVEGATVPLTVSIGGMLCNAEATVSELMRVADRRLYEAKNRGRNLAIFDQSVPRAA